MTTRKPRAIDLYSGIGGWSLGLRLSGVDVVASYEYWGPANETNFKNNAHQAQTVNIRRLAFGDLPDDIDIVVGSPPCTQFSFSNRGGGGDIDDGLEDIVQFLRIVDHLRPRVWAMENVPRVAKIIEAELQPGGKLEGFAHLGCVTHIVDMAEYGVPQRRRRCIAGNFDADLLESFKGRAPLRTLGDIVTALSADPVVDPIYGISVTRRDLTEHVEEAELSSEEARINRASKMNHTVYNAMPFPDRLDRPVRTITATCTRVSRESIVLPTNRHGFRRLTLRERASLQGFPVTFQFYGANYSQKVRMIGNAVPPAFTYIVGQVLQGRGFSTSQGLVAASRDLTRPAPLPLETMPDRVGAKFPAGRTFRFAVPNLQLKSGVRFELRNEVVSDSTIWRIAFYFGTSKAILDLELSAELYSQLKSDLSQTLYEAVIEELDKVAEVTAKADIANMQSVWAHKGPGGTRPFILLDQIDDAARSTREAIVGHEHEARSVIDLALLRQHGEHASELPGVAKLHRNAGLILAGLLIGSRLNPILRDRERASSNDGLRTAGGR